MRQHSTLLSLLTLTLVIGIGTSCSKQNVSPAVAKVAGSQAKVLNQVADTTYASQPYNDHQCGGGHGGQ